MNGNQDWTDIQPTEAGLYWYCGGYSDYVVELAYVSFGRLDEIILRLITYSQPSETSAGTVYPVRKFVDRHITGLWMPNGPPGAPNEVGNDKVYYGGLLWYTKTPTESGIYVFRPTKVRNEVEERAVIIITKSDNKCLVKHHGDSVFVEAGIEKFNGFWHVVALRPEYDDV